MERAQPPICDSGYEREPERGDVYYYRPCASPGCEQQLRVIVPKWFCIAYGQD